MQVDDAYSKDMVQLEIVAQLLTQTLSGQTSLNAAIKASTTLLLATAIDGKNQAKMSIVNTEAVLQGLGLDSLLRLVYDWRYL